jgi:hypothetical protein
MLWIMYKEYIIMYYLLFYFCTLVYSLYLRMLEELVDFTTLLGLLCFW